MFGIDILTRGDPLLPEQLRDGDYLVVRTQNTARDGDVVVVTVGASGTSVGRLARTAEGRVHVGAPPPSGTEGVEVMIRGVVTGVVRVF